MNKNLNNNTINTLDHPAKNNDELWKGALSSIVFTKPRLLPDSAWTAHVPFAFWLVDAIKPNLFVELGTHNGLSYFSFCQAIKQKKLLTKCFAIDTWNGDEHAGFYDHTVFEFVVKANQPYDNFSTLCRSTFDEALSSFENKSIDLLHIDGLHTYEAVKNDFYNWLPKMSESGVVLFHDTNVEERGFGVYQLWEELIKEYPFFEFKHGYGLGVLGVGKNLPAEISSLFKNGLIPQTKSEIQQVYERLGGLTVKEQQYNNIKEKAGLKNEIQPAIKNLQTEKYLHPLQSTSTQVYLKKQEEDFNEPSSLIQAIELTASPCTLLFKIEQQFSALKKLRVDPANEQGIFYLHSISLTNDEGEIFLNWEAIKNSCISSNLILLKSTLLENAFILIPTTNDPVIEIDLQPFNNLFYHNNFNVSIILSRSTDELLIKEFSNISINELKKNLHDDIDFYNTFFEDLQSVKKEITDSIEINTKEILLKLNNEHLSAINKVEQEKNNLQSELKEQQLLFNKNINESNENLQQKEGLINKLLKEIAAAKETEIILYQHLNQHKEEIQSLQTSVAKSQKDFVVLDLKSKEEIFALKKQLDEIIVVAENKKIVIEQQKQELFLKEENMKDLQEKISLLKNKYENNSLFGIIKNRITNADKK